MKTTFSEPIHPTEETLTKLKKLDDSFNLVKVDDLQAPIEVWEFLLEDLSLPTFAREVNGCGSKSTEKVPDTMWGLKVTPVCHIHDVMYKWSKTPEDCRYSNIVFLTNLTVFINNHSNFIIGWLRRYRATSYYSAVHSGRKQFCPGYKK